VVSFGELFLGVEAVVENESVASEVGLLGVSADRDAVLFADCVIMKLMPEIRRTLVFSEHV
jgi:hypothetical protein